jgi:oxygen-independent coproporphyrinogen-3 oxidase
VPTSLYVHAPFCRAKCRYCAFASQPTGRAGPDPDTLGRYLDALGVEAAQRARELGPFRPASLFLGGGTPSLLGARGLARLMDALRASFDVPDGIEMTLEANPDSATPEMLAVARSLGFNRLSLGVQSLRDADLSALGRTHSTGQARAAFAAARAAGFANVGLDLIFGLPGQGVAGWLAVLEQAAALKPEHLSCYGLTVEPGTPLAGDARVLSALPDEDVQAEMFLRGSELLEAAGYRHYEISNFARPGRECLHNSLGWRGGDVLGLGPAAVSTVTAGQGARRFANAPNLDLWAAAVAAGTPAPAWEETLDAATRARESLMLALRMAEGLDLSAFAARHGVDPLAGREDILRQMLDAGLVLVDTGRLRLTRQGMLVSNSVIRALAFEGRQEI